MRTREQHQDRQKRLAEDRRTSEQLLASPSGAALIRYLEVVWETKRIPGLGSTPEATAYRVARRDAIQQLKDIREEAGSDAA